MNTLKSPYTIRIIGVGKARPEAQNAIRLLVWLIKRASGDPGTEVQIGTYEFKVGRSSRSFSEGREKGPA